MADPLTESDLEQINMNLNNLKLAEQEIKKARQAGLDVETQAAEVRDARDRLLKIKQTYFPGS